MPGVSKRYTIRRIPGSKSKSPPFRSDSKFNHVLIFRNGISTNFSKLKILHFFNIYNISFVTCHSKIEKKKQQQSFDFLSSKFIQQKAANPSSRNHNGSHPPPPPISHYCSKSKDRPRCNGIANRKRSRNGKIG